MFRWVALISAIVCVLAVAGAVVSSQAPIESTQQQASEKKHSEQAKEKEHITLWDRWFPDSISVYTLFLVVFTALLAYVGFIQLKALDRAEGIAAKTAQAAKQSADAAKDAVVLSDKTAERQLRAYVFVDAVRIANVAVGQRPIAHIDVKNTGLTPARDLVAWAGITIGAYPLAVTLRKQTPEEQKTASRRFLGPNGSFFMEVEWSAVIIEKYMERLRSGDAIFVWGEITYTDVFDQPHKLTFRSYYGGDTPMRADGLTTNDADGNGEE